MESEIKVQNRFTLPLMTAENIDSTYRERSNEGLEELKSGLKMFGVNLTEAQAKSVLDVPYTTRAYVAITNWRNKTCSETTGFQNYATKAAVAFAYLFLTIITAVESVVRFILITFVLDPIALLCKSEKDREKFRYDWILPMQIKAQAVSKVFIYSVGSLKANCSSNLLIPNNFGEDNPRLIPEDFGKSKGTGNTPAPSGPRSQNDDNECEIYDDNYSRSSTSSGSETSKRDKKEYLFTTNLNSSKSKFDSDDGRSTPFSSTSYSGGRTASFGDGTDSD